MLLIEMTSGVHLPVKDTHYPHAGGTHPVENDVLLDPKGAETGRKFITSFANLRIITECVKRPINRRPVDVTLRYSPSAARVGED